MRFCDDGDFGFGWIVDDELLRRTSHALVTNGDVWLVDPVEWPDAEQRVCDAGRPRAVVQLLDRHSRDCAAVAERLGVPHHRVPSTLHDTPFEILPIARTLWKEVALWWPQERVLVAADVLGTVAYFVAKGEPVGVHPFLRMRPPRSLRRVFPEHILSGHGEGVHDDAAHALHEALRTSRRRFPAAMLSLFRHG